MVRFEGLLQTQPDQNLPIEEICRGLDVSERTLRTLCAEQLGMSPTGYLRLRRMSLVQRALGRGDADAVTVSEAAMRHGFRSLGRFAADYRALFGELPSVTLQRRLRAGMPDLARRR
jgi:AraC family ethanolamine operon transcriptional activator